MNPPPPFVSSPRQNILKFKKFQVTRIHAKQKEKKIKKHHKESSYHVPNIFVKTQNVNTIM